MVNNAARLVDNVRRPSDGPVRIDPVRNGTARPGRPPHL